MGSAPTTAARQACTSMQGGPKKGATTINCDGCGRRQQTRSAPSAFYAPQRDQPTTASKHANVWGVDPKNARPLLIATAVVDVSRRALPPPLKSANVKVRRLNRWLGYNAEGPLSQRLEQRIPLGQRAEQGSLLLIAYSVCCSPPYNYFSSHGLIVHIVRCSPRIHTSPHMD